MEQNELSQYRSTVAKIESLLKRDIELTRVFGQRLSRVKSVFQLVVCQMDLLAKDEKVELTDTHKNDVNAVSFDFLNVALYQPLSDIYRELSKEYIKLIFNWNRELGKSTDIEARCQTIINIVEHQETAVESTRILKQAMQRLEFLLNNSPPAFEHSKHYLESLKFK